MNIEIKSGALLIDNDKFTLSTHEVVEEIGRGANARVYSANNKELNRLEALKVWVPRRGKPRVDEKGFYAELRKNSQFTGNDSIATIYTGGCWNNTYYCLMEYCSGVTLKEFIRHNSSWIYRWGFARQISDTMRSIYEKGIYHGDLHDRNIMIDLENKDNNLKILDLGTSFFKGHDKSHRRDAENLYSLSFELLPCLRDLAFYNNESIANLPSFHLNRAFRSVINISNPTTPASQDYFDCHPSLYMPPNYSKLGIWQLVSMVETTPFFSLGLIEKFLIDYGFGADGIVNFYQELCKRIIGEIPYSNSEMFNIVTKKYNQLSESALERC